MLERATYLAEDPRPYLNLNPFCDLITHEKSAIAPHSLLHLIVLRLVLISRPSPAHLSRVRRLSFDSCESRGN